MKHTSYAEEIIKKAIILNEKTQSGDLGPLIDSIKNKKIVMLGESSHGTKEFYELRSEISKELIKNHGFKFIAVEGDWPPSQEINKFIQGQDFDSDHQINALKVLSHFTRWPTWMWANHQVLDFIAWLRANNMGKPRSCGFHGLDVYSLYESMDQVTKLLSKIDHDLALKSKSYYSCFDSYRHNEKAYARSLFHVPEGCKRNVLAALTETLQYKLEHKLEDHDQEILFDAIQNERIVCDAENYYRAMIFGDEDSWNVRDHHMMNTLKVLLNYYGNDSKAIVWAHNTHIGDYRATDMLTHGQINIGGLARLEFGKENVALVGFSTYSGSVIASHSWDGPIQVLPVPDAIPKTVEAEFHSAALALEADNLYVLLNNETELSPFAELRGHRAIGVVYYPPAERGNYVPTVLADRYDAFIFCDETHALDPLKVEVDFEKMPETYPYGTHI